MQDLSNINTIKEILSAHGFTFSKSLGQNFLINPTVCPRMAEACGADENTGVIEIGADNRRRNRRADRGACKEGEKSRLA